MTFFGKVSGSEQDIGNNLVIKACITKDDIERVAALNEEIHGREEGAAVRRWLLEGHPQIEPAGWLFVEDTTTGEAVATLGLMPLTWRYGPVSLPVAELGFVATRPDYRRRGLQRALSAAFDRIALANDYALAAIEGIPYFYRQFGYEYALPLFDSRFNFKLDQIPAGPLRPFSFRPAGPADIPRLMAFYNRQSASLTITTERSEAMWRYYLNLPTGVPFSLQIYLLLRDGQTIGYLALAPSGWANRLNVMELAAGHTQNLNKLTTDYTDKQSVKSAQSVVKDTILAALRFARAQAEAGGQESLGLQLPAGHPVSQIACSMGIKEERTYGWQMKVLDPVRFLNAIAPALEERSAASAIEETSGELNFNLYRHKVGLRIESGRIHAIALDPEAETDVDIPPLVATQLWLGWKSFAALDDWHKDVGAKEEKRHLLEALFPPTKAHIYLGY